MPEMDTKIQNQILSRLPAKQSDLWKALCINKRKVSKILINMEESGIITREKITQNNITTYIVQKNIKRPTTDLFKKSSLNPKGLMNKGIFSPCTSCIDICKPVECNKLTDWIL